jgi:Zn-dependent protease
VSPIFLGLIALFLGTGAALGYGAVPVIPGVLVFVLAGWVISLCLHEFGHAYIAHVGGDRSIEGKGYLTLDPIKYTDPVWSLLMPLLFLVMGGIGFPGGAVYIRPDLIRSRIMRSLTSLAGPMMSLAAGLACAVIYQAGVGPDGPFPGAPDEALWQGIALLAFLQFTAVIINMIPLPGLDGFGVIQPFIPAPILRAIMPVAQGLPIILIAVIFLIPGAMTPVLQTALLMAAPFGIGPDAVFAGLDAVRFWR